MKKVKDKKFLVVVAIVMLCHILIGFAFYFATSLCRDQTNVGFHICTFYYSAASKSQGIINER